MRDITQFIKKRSHEESLIKKFISLSKKVKSKKELRELEMKLLRPKPIPKYMGQRTSGRSPFKKRSIIITFPNEGYIDKISKICRVGKYIENNTSDSGFIVEILNLFESGRLVWDKKKQKYYLKTRRGRMLRI